MPVAACEQVTFKGQSIGLPLTALVCYNIQGSGFGLTALHYATILDEADCARRLILHNPKLTVEDEASFALSAHVQANGVHMSACALPDIVDRLGTSSSVFYA